MNDIAKNTGLFIATFDIGTGQPGAPLFRLALAANTVDKTVSGSGRITQATNPPLDVRTSLHGDFTYMTVMPQNTHILVVASGVPAGEAPHAMGLLNVELRMVLSDDWKSGTASFKYRSGGEPFKAVDDVPARLSQG